MEPTGIEGVLACMASALVYSLLFYAKKRVGKDKTKFEPKKLAATLIVGAVIGAFYGFYGIPIDQPTISELLVTYAGTVALVESLLKFLVRLAKKQMNKQSR